MAEQGIEQPELEDEVEDMEDEEVVEAAGSLPINQMALTLGRLRDRLKHATGGAVVMDALLDDKYTYHHAQIRLCSGNADREVQFLTHFRLPAADMKNGELFCIVGPGAAGRALVVGFMVDMYMAAGPRQVRSASAMALTSQFVVDQGTFVVFEDVHGDVLRGVVLAVSLYIPPEKKAPKLAKWGGQVVLFAYVYIAVRLTYCVVVMAAQHPRPLPRIHPVLPFVCADRLLGWEREARRVPPCHCGRRGADEEHSRQLRGSSTASCTAKFHF